MKDLDDILRLYTIDIATVFLLKKSSDNSLDLHKVLLTSDRVELPSRFL